LAAGRRRIDVLVGAPIALLIVIASLITATLSAAPLTRAPSKNLAAYVYDGTRQHAVAVRGADWAALARRRDLTRTTPSAMRQGRFGSAVFAAEDAGAGDLATSCANSFAADTPVLMADGKEEPIADVKVGDKVLATDPETGKTAARRVVALIRHSGKHTMVDLTLSDGSKITSTDGHPFWDATTKTFTDAIDLQVGDEVLSDNGRLLTIARENVYVETLTAYNLQIDGIHTYYAGTTPVLVHNSCVQPNLYDLPTAARTTSNEDYVFDRLSGPNHGIPRDVLSARLHDIKAEFGLGGADNVVFDMTGNVWDPRTGEYLGTLTQG
jgi:Pretoxin HINT domain